MVNKSPYSSTHNFWPLQRKTDTVGYRISSKQTIFGCDVEFNRNHLICGPRSQISAACTMQGKHPQNCLPIFFRIQLNILGADEILSLILSKILVRCVLLEKHISNFSTPTAVCSVGAAHSGSGV